MFKRKSKESKPKKKRRVRSLFRLMCLGVIGGGVALAVSEDLRNKALDKLFGAEEEFQYTPPADVTSENGAMAENGAAAATT